MPHAFTTRSTTINPNNAARAATATRFSVRVPANTRTAVTAESSNTNDAARGSVRSMYAAASTGSATCRDRANSKNRHTAAVGRYMQTPAASHASAPIVNGRPIAAGRARVRRAPDALRAIASHPVAAEAATTIDQTTVYFAGNLRDASSGRWSRTNG